MTVEELADLVWRMRRMQKRFYDHHRPEDYRAFLDLGRRVDEALAAVLAPRLPFGTCQIGRPPDEKQG